jgi:hypothetical protein
MMLQAGEGWWARVVSHLAGLSACEQILSAGGHKGDRTGSYVM